MAEGPTRPPPGSTPARGRGQPRDVARRLGTLPRARGGLGARGPATSRGPSGPSVGGLWHAAGLPAPLSCQPAVGPGSRSDFGGLTALESLCEGSGFAISANGFPPTAVVRSGSERRASGRRRRERDRAPSCTPLPPPPASGVRPSHTRTRAPGSSRGGQLRWLGFGPAGSSGMGPARFSGTRSSGRDEFRGPSHSPSARRNARHHRWFAWDCAHDGREMADLEPRWNHALITHENV